MPGWGISLSKVPMIGAILTVKGLPEIQQSDGAEGRG
jgi:hypothetical protein